MPLPSGQWMEQPLCPSNPCEAEMKRIVAKYTAGSLLCVGFLIIGTAQPQDSTAKGGRDSARQSDAPGFEPGPGPSGSRPDTTGTPGSMTSQSGKSAKKQMKECV